LKAILKRFTSNLYYTLKSQLNESFQAHLYSDCINEQRLKFSPLIAMKSYHSLQSANLQ